MRCPLPWRKSGGGDGGTHSPQTPFEDDIYLSQPKETTLPESVTLKIASPCSSFGVHLSFFMPWPHDMFHNIHFLI
jgi:hypothetical protein